MRKQSPLTALFALLLTSATFLAADAVAMPSVAHAAPIHARAVPRYHRRYRRVHHRYRRRFVRAAIPTGDVWARLRACESGGNYRINTGNGFYGAYQFAAGTWHGLGYSGLPHQAPPEVQDAAAQRLQARSGWGQWPSCSRRLGLR